MSLKEKPEAASSFIAFSCTHVPFHDPAAINFLLDRIDEFKPDYVICLGDLLEADSASRWPSEYSHTLSHEFKEANKLLSQVKDVSCTRKKKAELIFIEGNHDANILSINRIDKKLRDLVDYRDGKNIPEITNWDCSTRYEYSRRKGTFSIGACTFSHGFECSGGSDKYQSIALGWPNGCFISGHTHRPTPGPARQVMLTQVRPAPYWYLNAGTLRDMRCEYMGRLRQEMWGQAIVRGWSVPIKSPRLKRDTWDAECVLFRGFNDYL